MQDLQEYQVLFSNRRDLDLEVDKTQLSLELLLQMGQCLFFGNMLGYIMTPFMLK